jgi:ubiquinone/menaquinone biosynthesis C-methylase UbiE
MDIFGWIEQELKPKACTSEELIYNDMDSQSGRCLPVIYQPFDTGKKAHWQDRGSLFDYLSSIEGKKLLDFGPGDGWPSLIIAPFVDEVMGVEGSLRRVEVCAENARRLGISNVSFTYVAPGGRLPFKDNSFDGVMAATSIEQTPNPRVTLQELFRVLRQDGRLRMSYEALGEYRNGRERDIWLLPINDHTCRLILYNRQIDREQVRQYGITFAMSQQEVIEYFSSGSGSFSFDMMTIPLLEKARSAVIDIRFCSLTHPSGRTFASWLKDVGFREVIPSHSGSEFAGQLFDQLPEKYRPKDIEALDTMLQPLVRIVVRMAAPLSVDPMITAIK